MTDYVKSTSFASKDALAVGNPLKIVKGTEIDTEFNNIAIAIATKADANNAALTGVPVAPTAAAGTSTTQIATTAFVQGEKANPTFSGTVTAPTVSFGGSWTITESGGVLYFKHSGVNKFKLDSSGNFTAVGDVAAFGSV